MELSNYELVRYPSGQVTLTRVATNEQGMPTSGPRDVIGVFATEAEAQSALTRLMIGTAKTAERSSRAA